MCQACVISVLFVWDTHTPVEVSLDIGSSSNVPFERPHLNVPDSTTTLLSQHIFCFLSPFITDEIILFSFYLLTYYCLSPILQCKYLVNEDLGFPFTAVILCHKVGPGTRQISQNECRVDLFPKDYLVDSSMLCKRCL